MMKLFDHSFNPKLITDKTSQGTTTTHRLTENLKYYTLGMYKIIRIFVEDT